MCVQADVFQKRPGILYLALVKPSGCNVYNGLCCCRTVFVTTHAIRYYEQVRLSILQVENGGAILLFFPIAKSQRRGILPGHRKELLI